MQETEVPQDEDTSYQGFHKIRYARTSSGSIAGFTSNGYAVEREVMDVAWHHIEQKVQECRQRVLRGELSPLALHMEINLLEPQLLAQNVGLWTWQVKRHMKPKIFARLSPKMLQRYADYLNISVEALCSIQKGSE